MKKTKFRTDLAIEEPSLCDKRLPEGVFCHVEEGKNIRKTVVEITSAREEKRLLRKRGKYVTLEGDFFFKDEFIKMLEDEVKKMIPSGKVLVAGFGNLNITPDSLGPVAAMKVMATSHLTDEFKKSFDLGSLRDVSVIFPGSSGQTGMETSDIIKALLNKNSFSSVITVDALASLSCRHMGKTVQITDCGISPGSGVGNKREEISFETLGVPVISIGIPTVSSSFVICGREKKDTDLILTPKNIDVIIEKGSEIIAQSLNYALHENIPKESISLLV